MKTNKIEKDYRALFFVGVTFVAVGVVFLSSVNSGLGAAFMVIGGMFMVIGGKNKDKWPKK